MPTLNITKTYADGSVLNESDLDAIRNSIETFVNTTKLDADNLQDGAVTAAKLATSAVTTAKLANDAVTAAKLASDAVVTTSIQDDAVTAAKIADGAVGSDAVSSDLPTYIAESFTSSDATTIFSALDRSTGSDVDTAGVAISPSSSDFTNSDTTYIDVTNLEVEITTSGKPVYVGLTGGNIRTFITGASVSGTTARFRIMRDTTEVEEFELAIDGTGTGSSVSVTVPGGSINCIDSPSAGTYTYKLQARGLNSNNQAQVRSTKLIAYEL